MPLGDLKTAARELNAIFNRGRKAEAKTALEEWIAKVKLRQQALVEFTEKLGKEVIEKLEKRLDGEVKIKGILTDGSKTLKATGMHSWDEVIEGRVKIKGETIPPNPGFDEPFIAKPQRENPYNKGQWVNKKSLGKEGDLSTFFPKNWNKKRIQEEVAHAWKDMKIEIEYKNDKGVFIQHYIGKTTTGFNVELVFNDGILKTAYPKI